MAAAGSFAPVGGNSVRLLTTGEEEFAELERQIRSAARASIHITTFILGRDETGRRIVELLAQRAREGVKVRLLLDAVGCFMSVAGLRGSAPEGGRRGGAVHARACRSRRAARRICATIARSPIFDQRDGHRRRPQSRPRVHGARAPTRSAGAISARSSRARPPSLLNEIFIADWCFASAPVPRRRARRRARPGRPEPRGACELQVVASGPDVPGDALYEGILALIQEAERSIWIVTPYFIPDEVLLRSLMVKARAGREVTLDGAGAARTIPIADFARRYSPANCKRPARRCCSTAGHDARARR